MAQHRRGERLVKQGYRPKSAHLGAVAVSHRLVVVKPVDEAGAACRPQVSVVDRVGVAEDGSVDGVYGSRYSRGGGRGIAPAESTASMPAGSRDSAEGFGLPTRLKTGIRGTIPYRA